MRGGARGIGGLGTVCRILASPHWSRWTYSGPGRQYRNTAPGWNDIRTHVWKTHLTQIKTGILSDLKGIYSWTRDGQLRDYIQVSPWRLNMKGGLGGEEFMGGSTRKHTLALMKIMIAGHAGPNPGLLVAHHQWAKWCIKVFHLFKL